LDVSQNPELSERYEIKYTPTILVFSKGKLTAQRKVGGASREVLVEYINRAFNLPKGKKPRATKATLIKRHRCIQGDLKCHFRVLIRYGNGNKTGGIFIGCGLGFNDRMCRGWHDLLPTTRL